MGEHVFNVLGNFLQAPMTFPDKTDARRFFHQLTQTTRDWNRVDMDSESFTELQTRLEKRVSEVSNSA